MCRWVGAERLAEEAWSEVGHGLCDVSVRGTLMVLGHRDGKKKLGNYVKWFVCAFLSHKPAVGIVKTSDYIAVFLISMYFEGLRSQYSVLSILLTTLDLCLLTFQRRATKLLALGSRALYHYHRPQFMKYTAKVPLLHIQRRRIVGNWRRIFDS